MDVHGLLRAFRHAGRGIIAAFRTQQSFRIQTLAGFIVIGAILLLPLNETVSAVLVFVVAVVLAFELLNTAFERFVNVFHAEQHPGIRDAKDFSAGAVLVTALGAAVVGAMLLF